MENNRARVLLSDAVGPSNGSNHEDTRRFGVFELDRRAGELRRQGRKVKLQEQPFQLLLQLLEKPGEVVTREELRNRLWPADTFVDFDHSLNAAIRRLRDALGDSAENPTFVETVARRGYRFLAPVSSAPMNGNGSLQSQAAIPIAFPASVHPPRWWVAAIAVAAALVTLGLVLGFFFFARREPAPVHITRLTANPIDDPVRAAAISRDGRYLAFSDETGFYLRLIDTGETHSVPLPPDLAASSISWFPDSVHMIVALTGERGECSLWELSALGGEARKLVDDGRFPAVSPNGKEVAFVAGKALREKIWLAATDGTQARELIGENGDLFGGVTWSPDGQKLAYSTAKFSYGSGVKAVINVLDVPAAGSQGLALRPATVLSLFGLEGAICWAPDGRLIYSVAEPRPRQLDSNLFSTLLDRQNQPVGKPLRLTSDQGSVFSISVSGDGKRIIYVKGVPEPDVYVATLDASGALSEPQRLTLDDRQDMPFDWTPDNKQVIFISDRTGTFSVYKQALGQMVPDMLIGGSQPVAEPRLSPDGTQLLYVVYPSWGDSSNQVLLMRAPLAGGAPQQVAKADWISNHQCTRAPANRCVYSVARGDKITFYSFDPFKGTGSQIFQLKDELSQLYNWSLSPDGSTLAIARGKWGENEEGRIHLVSLNGAPERWIKINASRNLASIDWAADSKSLWAPTSADKDNELLQIDLRGNVRPVWHPKKIRVGWAIPSRDGKKLALHVNSTSANIWMLDRQ
jgi:DNA-binding winged helix-turn-helix (wHTH) protein/Tol biopolymer transport system component